MLLRTCEGCGSEFTPKRTDRLRFCSRECSFKTQKEIGNLTVGYERKAKARPIWFNTCLGCGRLFRARQRRTTCCSDGCFERASSIRRNAHKRTARQCPECLQLFTPTFGHTHRRFCSNGCTKAYSKRASKAARRARKRGNASEQVNPLAVFARDGWTCQLCGVRTPKKLRGTLDNKAPELDHILPLAADGEHSYRNTQCLCRKCNQDKGAKPLGQLRLVG